jgi:hypothetical protein
MAVRFFHTPKNKSFKFTTRYYDESKEELDKRVAQIKQEMGIDDGDPNKPYVSKIRKGEMRGFFKKTQQQKKKSTIRLIIILAILLLMVYFLLYF